MSYQRRPDLIIRFNDAFKSEAPEEVARLKKAVADGDAVKAALTAHAIGALARRIEAKSLQQAAGEIESLAHGGKLADTEKIIASLDDLVWEAVSEANKTTIDRRLEGVEEVVRMLAQSIDSSLQQERTLMDEMKALVQGQTQATQKLASVLENLFTPLVQVVAGKDQVPSSSHQWMVRILGYGNIFLIVIIGILVTGRSLGKLAIPGLP